MHTHTYTHARTQERLARGTAPASSYYMSSAPECAELPCPLPRYYATGYEERLRGKEWAGGRHTHRAAPPPLRAGAVAQEEDWAEGEGEGGEGGAEEVEGEGEEGEEGGGGPRARRRDEDSSEEEEDAIEGERVAGRSAEEEEAVQGSGRSVRGRKRRREDEPAHEGEEEQGEVEAAEADAGASEEEEEEELRLSLARRQLSRPRWAVARRGTARARRWLTVAARAKR